VSGTTGERPDAAGSTTAASTAAGSTAAGSTATPTAIPGPAAPLPLAGSAHLSLLVDELDALVARLRTAVADVRTRAPERLEAVRAAHLDATADASLRLDGGLRVGDDGGTERHGTWLDALGATVTAARERTDADGAATSPDEAGLISGTADEVELERLAALEQAGVRAGIAADDLADAFGRASSDASGLGNALAVLHGRITDGLVAPERAGRLRRGPRVVHDASVGRVLFFPTDPELLADAWDLLLRHVTGSGAGGRAARQPAVVRAALLHLELLRHHPFDAANGRVARAAARLALIADGLVPDGLGAPDTVLAEDPLGYLEGVAASLRRRDATAWVERALEAQGASIARVLAALDGLADAAGATPPTALGEVFTLGDVVEQLGVTSAIAREHTSAWVVAGTARRVIGSAGLRLTRA